MTLALGVVSTATVGAMVLTRGRLSAAGPTFDPADRVVYGVFWGINVWCWCANVLYLGQRWLTRSGGLVRYGSESALPVYIISEPVIVVLGSYILGRVCRCGRGSCS